MSMHGLEKIIETILTSADLKQSQIIGPAKAEAEEVTNRYNGIVTERSNQLEQEAKTQAEQSRERIVAAAELEMRKSVLQAKQDLIDEAFHQAIAKVAAAPEAELVTILAQLAAQAAASGQEELILNQQAHQAYGTKVIIAANQLLEAAGKPANLKLAAVPREIGLGLVLKDGLTEVNCILERLIWDQREALASEVASLLFTA